MAKKIFIVFIVLVALCLVGIFILKQKKNLQTQPVGMYPVIKIECEYWPGVYWVVIAEKKGWFKEAGLNVQLIDGSIDYNQKLQDMVDGKMEENDFPLYDLMKFNAKGAD